MPTPSAPAEPLTVESSLDLLLVLLYAPGHTKKPGEPIDGITRLQKLMFLLQQGRGPSDLAKQAKEYFYKPYKMGPFSSQLSDELDLLMSLGLVETERLTYVLTDDSDSYPSTVTPRRTSNQVESLRFKLTPEGLEAGAELWKSLRAKDRQGLSEFKQFFNSLSLRQLLIFVYEKYPEFTSKSEIKDQLGQG